MQGRANRGRRVWVWPLVIILASFFLAGVCVFFAWDTNQRRVGPPDYCPTGTWSQERKGIRIPGHTAILIDTSNRIGTEDRTLAFEAATTWARDLAPFLQRLSIYGLPESGREMKPSSDSFCVPKEGDDANLIYEHPVFVEAQFRRFLARLESILAELVDREEADRSPIAETMAALVDQHDDLDSFLIVSDMLQNTDAWSHYLSQGSATEAAVTCGQITAPGKVKAVYVYHIDRQLEVQTSKWPDDWWRECLADIETRMLNDSR